MSEPKTHLAKDERVMLCGRSRMGSWALVGPLRAQLFSAICKRCLRLHSAPLTRWQQQKAQSLADERHPILSRLRGEQERPGDRRLLRHIERQLDWYQLKEAKPGREIRRAETQRLEALVRKADRLLKKPTTR